MVERKCGTRKTEKANSEGNRLVSCVGIKQEHDLQPALRISFWTNVWMEFNKGANVIKVKRHWQLKKLESEKKAFGIGSYKV